MLALAAKRVSVDPVRDAIIIHVPHARRAHFAAVGIGLCQVSLLAANPARRAAQKDGFVLGENVIAGNVGISVPKNEEHLLVQVAALSACDNGVAICKGNAVANALVSISMLPRNASHFSVRGTASAAACSLLSCLERDCFTKAANVNGAGNLKIGPFHCN